MKPLSSEVLALQTNNVREPITKLVVRDSMLRWELLDSGAASPTSGYGKYDGDEDIPCVFGDACLAATGTHLNISYLNSSVKTMGSYNLSTGAYSSVVAGITTTYEGRMSSFGNDMYFCSNDGCIYKLTSTSMAPLVYGNSSNTAKPRAVAAVAQDKGYLATLITSGENQYVEINHWDSSSGVTVKRFAVEADYDTHSLSFFDAVRMDDGTDLILVNTKAYGKAMLFRCNFDSSTSWTASDLYPAIPTDIVDNYSFVRIGFLSKIEDYYILSGTIGREGSTGVQPQEWDSALRSKDGIHWSFDRYQYLGGMDMRSPLIGSADGTYVYKLDGSNLYVAPNVVRYGLDLDDAGSDHINYEIVDDIFDWNLTATQASTTLLNDLRQYDVNSSDTPLKPGYELMRYAGYKHNGTRYEDLISVEGLDVIKYPYSTSGGNRITLLSRPLSHRLMTDYKPDQDYQWLSQGQHHDDCTTLSKAYALSGTVPEIDSYGLKTQDYNDPLIMATTLGPIEDFQVSAIFSIDNDVASTTNEYLGNALGFRDAYSVNSQDEEAQRGTAWVSTDFPGYDGTGGSSNAATEANDFQYPETLVGSMFGVFGSAVDDENFIAAVVDIVEHKLYFMDRVDGVWSRLDSGTSFDSGYYVKKGIRYEVEMKKEGIEFSARVTYYYQTTKEVVAESTYTYDGDLVLDEGLVGTITNIRVPETQSFYTETHNDYIARDWSFWAASGATSESHNSEDRFFEFENGDHLHIGEEELIIDSMTYSNKHEPYSEFINPDYGPFEVELYPNQFEPRLISLKNSSSNIDSSIRSWYLSENSSDQEDREHLGWLFAAIHNKGAGIVTWIDQYNLVKWGTTTVQYVSTNYWIDVTDSTYTHARALCFPQSMFSMPEYYDEGANEYYVPPSCSLQMPLTFRSSVDDEDYATFYALVPGFKVTDINGSPRSQSGGDTHAARTQVLAHRNDYIIIHSVNAYDREHEKSMDWALKDVISKSGVLDFYGATSYEDTDNRFVTFVEDGSEVSVYSSAIDFDVELGLSKSLICDHRVDSLFYANTSSTSDGDLNVAIPSTSTSITGEVYSTRRAIDASKYYRYYVEVDCTNAHNGYRPPLYVHLEYYDASNVLVEKQLVGTYLDANDQVFSGISNAPTGSTKVRVQIEAEVCGGSFYEGNESSLQWQLKDFYVAEIGNPSSAYTVDLELDNTSTSRSFRLFFDYKSSSDFKIYLYQDNGSFEYFISEVDIDPRVYGARVVRVVKRNRHLNVYFDDYLVHTFCIFSPTDSAYDGYNDILYTSPGELKVTASGIEIFASAKDLWQTIDAVITDQQTNTISAVQQRLIRDARIKYFSAYDDGIKLSRFTNRLYAGTLRDIITSISSNPTDQIPTHVRAVGAEISEYVNHEVAAEYGLLFHMLRVESLDEQEAYDESQRVVNDALSYSDGRQLRVVPSLEFEREDYFLIDLTTYDGNIIDEEPMLIDNTTIAFKGNHLDGSAVLRRNYD